MVNCLIYLCIITKTGGQKKTTRLKGKIKMEKNTACFFKRYPEFRNYNN